MFLSVYGIVSSVTNIKANLLLDQIHVQKRVEFHQFMQALERFWLVLERKGRIRSFRVIKDIKIGEIFFFLCLAGDALKMKCVIF